VGDGVNFTVGGTNRAVGGVNWTVVETHRGIIETECTVIEKSRVVVETCGAAGDFFRIFQRAPWVCGGRAG